ncbi:hypothetical protein AWV80_01210 [Cupriavidus sp. UYMU48A]|nr:hypothetical protein AWV80_01210 [Cupriavidus sp. UYMU48A]
MNTAAAAFAGTPAAAPAAAPAGTPPAGDPGTPPSGTLAAAPAATPPASNDTWYSGFDNADVRTWTQAKGFKDPAALAESAWNLEKLLGHERAGRTVVIPGDDAPAEEVSAFRAKMGVPEKADDYLSVIKVPEGQPDTFAKEAANWFHEAGIPPKQAAMLAEKWNAYQEAGMQAQTQQQAADADKAFGEVVASWGKDADANLELGKRAASQFIPAKDAAERQAILGKLEGAIGTKAMLEMFANIGRGLGEHKVHSNGDPGGMGMSAAEAQAKIASLKADKAWTSAYLQGDTAKKTEMERLIKLAYPTSA